MFCLLPRIAKWTSILLAYTQHEVFIAARSKKNSRHLFIQPFSLCIEQQKLLLSFLRVIALIIPFRCDSQKRTKQFFSQIMN